MTIPIKSTIGQADSTSKANIYSDLNGLAAPKQDPHSPQALRAVAQQVDALFLQMMLKSMRDASAATGESDSNEMGMYQDMFDKQIALNLSQHQNLGLGALLTRQLGGANPPAGAPAAAGTPAAASAPGATAPVRSQMPALRPAAAAPAGAPVASTSIAQTAGEFVSRVLPSIRAAAQALGLDPLGMLAQAALETGWGRRMARNPDGTPSLNLFGVKADEKWSGARATASTVEVVDGVVTPRHAVFRAYASIEDSVSDFAHLLRNSPHYRLAVAAGGDAQSFVNHMGRSGYATDPRYADKLNDILHSSTLRAAVKFGTTKL